MSTIVGGPRVRLDKLNVYVYTTGNMRVFQSGSYLVYVYRELQQPHHLPHCHVYWDGGGTVVALPTLSLLAGPWLPASARRLLSERLDEIWDCWVTLNPEVA